MYSRYCNKLNGSSDQEVSHRCPSAGLHHCLDCGRHHKQVRLQEDRHHGRPTQQDPLCRSPLPRPSLPWRSGSLPSLHSIQITSSPTILVRSTSNLYLNGFSVTLEELEEMFQVGRWLLKSPGKSFHLFAQLHKRALYMLSAVTAKLFGNLGRQV